MTKTADVVTGVTVKAPLRRFGPQGNQWKTSLTVTVEGGTWGSICCGDQGVAHLSHDGAVRHGTLVAQEILMAGTYP